MVALPTKNWEDTHDELKTEHGAGYAGRS